MRGLADVRAEFSLTALAYNLRRALNLLGVETMIGRRTQGEARRWGLIRADMGAGTPLRPHPATDKAKSPQFPRGPLPRHSMPQVVEFPHGRLDLSLSTARFGSKPVQRIEHEP